MGFSIVGFTSTDKVPGFVGKVEYGAGASSASGIPVVCLLVGTKLAAGTATADADVVDITTSSDADTAFGAGSELARMCYIALNSPGVLLKAAAVSEAAGAVAATAVITFATNASSSGTYKLRVDGVELQVGVANLDTPTAVATATRDAINGNPTLPVTASNTAGVLTITRKSKGVRGNEGTMALDLSSAPTGMTAVVSVAVAMTGTNRYRFAGGTGTETPTNILAALLPRDDRFVGIAQNDQTNLTSAGLWRDWVNTRSGALEGRPVFVTFASTANAAPTAVATAVNDQLFALGWMKNGESHPSEIAAGIAAERSVRFAADPGFNTAGIVLKGIKAQVNSADKLNRAAKVSALNFGITPINSSPDDRVYIERGITTHCQRSGSTDPDYNTLDWADAQVPQYVRLDLGTYWTTAFQPNNPRNADDVPEGAEERKAGVATPSLWSSQVYKKLKDYEISVNGSPPIIIDVDDPTLAVKSFFDKTAKRIMSNVPVRVAPGNYQIGVSVLQTVLG
jgi:phage tail sheath gpL-like